MGTPGSRCSTPTEACSGRRASTTGKHDWATGVTFDPENGDLIVVGSFEKYSWDIFVQRLSQGGEERWFSELDGYGFDDYANAVTLDEHGAIWAVGLLGSRRRGQRLLDRQVLPVKWSHGARKGASGLAASL